MLDARSITTTYSYDALNRQINRVFTTPADATLTRHIDTVATRYDGNNNNIVLTRENYSNGTQHTTTQQYDDFDRMEIMTDPYGRTLVYGYDLNGNRTQLTDPDNLTTSYVYDALNRAVSVTNQQGTTTYDYDRSSLLRLVVYPNGTRSAMAYDQALRTDTITNTLGASSVISSFEYDYDDNGNRIEQREQNGGGVEVTIYDYDALDRLERVTYPDNITTYTYDPAYNRDTEVVTSSDGATTLKDLDYVYDPRNQLTDINDQLDPAQNISYTFDGNGNQISKLVDSNTTEFIYDARDNLRQVLTGGSSIGQFLYDDKGMRIEKLGDRGTERYTYDDLSVITQSDASNSTVAKYDYGAARLLSLSHDTEGTQFYLSDALGSVANLTRADGGIQARYQYDAFGNYRAQVGTSHNRFGFTGHEVDTETGLIYFKARFYDPETGRFLSHDAFEGTQDNPPSLHKYLYAFQNPTIYVDLDGRFPVTKQIADFLARSSENQSDFVVSLNDVDKSSFGRNVDVRALGLLATVTSDLTGLAGAIVGATDAVLDAEASLLLPETSTIGFGSRLANERRANEIRSTASSISEFAQRDDALQVIGQSASAAASQYVDDLADGKIEATSRVGAIIFETLTGVGLARGARLIPENIDGPYASPSVVDQRLGATAGGADAELGNLTDQQLIDTNIEIRQRESISTNSTLSSARDIDGLVTPVRQDIKSPDLDASKNIHAEPQSLADLDGKSGTLAVDQIPCGPDKLNCAGAIADAGNVRVIVPERVIAPGKNPKTAADKAANRGESVRPREL